MKRYTKKVLDKTGQLAVDTLKGIGSLAKDILVGNIKVVLILFAAFWFWENKVDTSALKSFLSKGSNVLTENQVARADVDCRDGSLVLQRTGEEPERIVGVKTGTFIQNKDGSYEADYKNRGFGIEPGVAVTAGDGLRLGIDGEFAYWKRWGLLGGATIPVSGRSFNRLRAHIALGYDLPSKWLSSTSIYGGIDSAKNPTIGLRTRIGGGI